MEYHVRPFPQQPHRGGKELEAALADLENVFSEDIPDLERVREIQAHMHETANHFNDDKLVDMIRQISIKIDEYQTRPAKTLVEEIVQSLLKVRVELKRL